MDLFIQDFGIMGKKMGMDLYNWNQKSAYNNFGRTVWLSQLDKRNDAYFDSFKSIIGISIRIFSYNI